VCKLQKSIYGLKQASRQWNHKLTPTLSSQGFTQSETYYSLFVKKYNSKFNVVLVYVDDFLITGNSITAIESLKRFLQEVFTIKDLGEANFFFRHGDRKIQIRNNLISKEVCLGTSQRHKIA